MPKKKIQHKGKSKYVTEENEELTFRKNENAEDEYTTVVDFETSKKYNKRLIQSNWSKYEPNPSDFEFKDEGIESPRTDDFSDLLKMASSDFSHFELSSEKLWKSELNSVAASKIFNLDLNMLSKGLACVPFYERMALDVSELTTEEVESFDKEAENNLKDYNLERKILMDKTGDSKIKNLENDSETFAESVTVKPNLEGNSKENEEIDVAPEMVGRTQEVHKNVPEVKILDSNQFDSSKRQNNKEKIFSNENDENLEDWLDSVLDD